MENGILSLWWFYPLLLAQRGGELLLCARNRRKLLARGGSEHAPESYRAMVILHAGFYLTLLFEAFPFAVPADLLTWSMLGLWFLVQIGRYWVIASLGVFWTTRIVVVPGTTLIRKGPYRWLQHPNYLVITLEFAIVPLLLRAPVTLLLFSLANLVVLRHRIALEEAALKTLKSSANR
ncbi:15-methylpalmitoyl-4-hydroxy-2-pyrone 4-O-methyltransferase [Geothermobacter ehrlichii]|uniref:15-methylpalmitoyl-4-hydroxy-2-pyrone 4-O-methyltransferase n=1 Tax=Geothermobacter ehrlichii TaxID=213224 RepID=A0A5D3WL32_9BACT|nr:isoprenylcysteine carboxylmethyltransferase family protein [Geothermobacter ehrlichii]TYO98965.1 15-methylpalmitoyl-4-hydroxy-2-pyrone 4-O-methyltransferase [Geothermobacter ehrlichii]